MTSLRVSLDDAVALRAEISSADLTTLLEELTGAASVVLPRVGVHGESMVPSPSGGLPILDDTSPSLLVDTRYKDLHPAGDDPAVTGHEFGRRVLSTVHHSRIDPLKGACWLGRRPEWARHFRRVR
jgi:hypothetical protein